MRASRRSRRAWLAVLLAGGLACGPGAAAGATPSPDPSFGVDGVVVDASTSSFTDALPMADGGVVAAGVVRGPSGTATGVVVRYDRSGRPVPTFGDAGTTTIARAGYAITLDHVEHGPAGTLVVFGSYERSATDHGVVVGRLVAANGVLDPAFATGGLLLRRLGTEVVCDGNFAGGGRGGTVLPDGRILVSCMKPYRSTADPLQGPVLATFSTRGLPVGPFGGTDGQVLVPLGSDVEPGRVAVAADGKVVVGLGATSGALGALRLLPTGARDATFSGDAVAWRRPFGVSDATGTAVPVMATAGRVLVSNAVDLRGYTDVITEDLAIVAFTGSGASDLTFNAGAGYTRVPTMYVTRAQRMPDWSVVLVGAEHNGQYQSEVCGIGPVMPAYTGRVAHVSASGVPDLSFGPGGVRDVPVPGADQSALTGVAAGPGSLTFSGSHNHCLGDLAANSTFTPPEGTLLRLAGTRYAPRTVSVNATLSGAYGLFRPCGSTLSAPCPIGTTWYFMGKAWPLEAHDPPRVVVQLDRRSATGQWVRSATLTAFVTDDGNFRAAGSPRSVGTYRVRAAVPASASTLLTYGPWRYFHR